MRRRTAGRTTARPAERSIERAIERAARDATGRPAVSIVPSVMLAMLLCIGSSDIARAQDEPGASDGETEEGGTEERRGGERGLFGRMGESIDRTRDRVSGGFTDFVTSVDGFFGGGSESEISNESWARLRIDGLKPGGEDFEFDATVKVRVKFPLAEERFRLLISSEDEETSVVGAEGAERPDALDSPQGQDQDVSLALRFVRVARDTSSVKFDLGVRQRDGSIQVFGRINTIAEGEIAQGWTGRASNSFTYFAKSGYRNQMRFDVSRVLHPRGNFYFRTSTGFDWAVGTKGAFANQTIGIYGDLGESAAIAFEALGGYATSVIDDLPRYRGSELRIRYRQSVWRPWFFYEVWPTVSWPFTQDYDQVYGGLLRVEALFGADRS